jgi:hypothetical protein
LFLVLNRGNKPTKVFTSSRAVYSPKTENAFMQVSTVDEAGRPIIFVADRLRIMVPGIWCYLNRSGQHYYKFDFDGVHPELLPTIEVKMMDAEESDIDIVEASSADVEEWIRNGDVTLAGFSENDKDYLLNHLKKPIRTF